jgi:hypothetical protein
MMSLVEPGELGCDAPGMALAPPLVLALALLVSGALWALIIAAVVALAH